jgi:peptidoglycan/xylan/chitin deacetylase (PgdA/CDA1 family)
VVSRLVMDDPALAEALTSAGEVGSQTSDHMTLAGLALDDQQVRLRRSWTEIRGWSGSGPTGLRPPEEAFDTNTLHAWARAGGKYILAVNQARSGSPEIHRVGDRQVVLLPRLLKDDYNVIVQEGTFRGARLSEAYLEGTDKLRALGGLAVVASHTQILEAGSRLNAIRDVAERVRAQGDWWVAEGNQVATWWEGRGAVKLSLDEAGPTTPEAEAPGGDSTPENQPSVSPAAPAMPGLDLLVEAPLDRPISGLWVDVVIPDPGPRGLIPLVSGNPVSFATTEWGLRISVGDLAEGETRLISLRPPPADSLGLGPR